MNVWDLDRLGQHEKVHLIVDSRYRDRSLYPESNDFVVTLQSPLQNVVGIEVISATIPKTDYAVDKGKDSICISFTGALAAGNWSVFSIPHGNYDLLTFAATFNAAAAQLGVGLQLTSVSTLSGRFKFYNTAPFWIDFERTTMRKLLGATMPAKFSAFGITGSGIGDYTYQAQLISGVWVIECPGLADFTGEHDVYLRIPELEQRIGSTGCSELQRTGIARFQVTGNTYNNTVLDFVKLQTRRFRPIAKLARFRMHFTGADTLPYDFKGIDAMVEFVIHTVQMQIPRAMSDAFLAGKLAEQPLVRSQDMDTVSLIVQSDPNENDDRFKEGVRGQFADDVITRQHCFDFETAQKTAAGSSSDERVDGRIPSFVQVLDDDNVREAATVNMDADVHRFDAFRAPIASEELTDMFPKTYTCT